nr:uncharacterized protein LOC109177003 isoform X1 [Ipomoea batatas]
MTQTLNSSNNRDKLNGLKQSIKFLYSYGGRIVPRRPDGKLRYIGGFTRVLSVHRSINFAELMVKFGESCGESMSLRCKLPTEDLDVLVSVRSDEDLANVIEEYDRVSAATNQEMKIRAVLSPINPLKKVSPPSSPMSCFDFPATSRLYPVKISGYHSPPQYKASSSSRCSSPVFGYPVGGERLRHCHHCNGAASHRPQHVYTVLHGNRSQ